MSSLEKIFEEVDTLEKQIKKKYPAQRGRVLIANIKSIIDYEQGRPETEPEHIKWAIEYRSKLKVQADQ